MTPAEIVASLKAMGISQRTIGAALGINDSYISQVRRGEKSGAKYADALRQLIDYAAPRKEGGQKKFTPDELTGIVNRPERRRTKSGKLARVRGAKYHAAGFTMELGPGATRRGAPTLGRAIQAAFDAGLQTAWTLEFKAAYDGVINPEMQSGKKKHQPKKSLAPTKRPKKEVSWIEFKTSPEDLEEMLNDMEDGFSPVSAVVRFAWRNQYISSGLTVIPDNAVSSIQMRAW